MSVLVICKHRKEYGHTWHQLSLLRPNIIKQHKNKINLHQFYHEFIPTKFSLKALLYMYVFCGLLAVYNYLCALRLSIVKPPWNNLILRNPGGSSINVTVLPCWDFWCQLTKPCVYLVCLSVEDKYRSICTHNTVLSWSFAQTSAWLTAYRSGFYTFSLISFWILYISLTFLLIWF